MPEATKGILQYQGTFHHKRHKLQKAKNKTLEFVTFVMERPLDLFVLDLDGHGQRLVNGRFFLDRLRPLLLGRVCG